MEDLRSLKVNLAKIKVLVWKWLSYVGRKGVIENYFVPNINYRHTKDIVVLQAG